MCSVICSGRQFRYHPSLGFAAFVAKRRKNPSPSVANGGFAPLRGAAAISMAALKSSVANEVFAPLRGAAAIPMAALKTPIAPVASPEEGSTLGVSLPLQACSTLNLEP